MKTLRDRVRLREELQAAFGATLLAYCIMDTHVHVIVEASEISARRWFEAALRSYLRAFNKAQGLEGGLLRGPVDVREKVGAAEIARAIFYVHDNPLRTTKPIVARAVDYEWSSAREFAGLSGLRAANVARAIALMESEAWRARPQCPGLADLVPATIPGPTPDVLIAAASQVVGVHPADLVGNGRTKDLRDVRAIFSKLGRTEGYTQEQLAAFARRDQSQISRVAAHDIPLDLVRIARTLVREPALRARLPVDEARRACAAPAATGPPRS